MWYCWPRPGLGAVISFQEKIMSASNFSLESIRKKQDSEKRAQRRRAEHCPRVEQPQPDISHGWTTRAQCDEVLERLGVALNLPQTPPFGPNGTADLSSSTLLGRFLEVPVLLGSITRELSFIAATRHFNFQYGQSQEGQKQWKSRANSSFRTS